MGAVHQWNNVDKGKPNYSDINLSWQYVSHQNSHMILSDILARGSLSHDTASTGHSGWTLLHAAGYYLMTLTGTQATTSKDVVISD
jgi:hypothetical protein